MRADRIQFLCPVISQVERIRKGKEKFRSARKIPPNHRLRKYILNLWPNEKPTLGTLQKPLDILTLRKIYEKLKTCQENEHF